MKMKMKIVGVEHRVGNYNGVDYDNYIIHTLSEEPYGSCIAGGLTDTYKIKAKAVREIFGGEIKLENDFSRIIGRSATIFCDKYGNPLMVDLKD